MRIISGRFRRRLLLTSPGQTTRPITDRVKESLFERIEGSLKNARVADIFAGTGTIGLEALSRGARSAVFIEQDRQAYELLLQNVATLEATDETICWRTDAVRSSFRPHGGDDFRPYDVVFFDPPFPMIAGLRAGSPLYKALQRLARPDVSAAKARLVLRVPEHSQFDIPGDWVLDWTLTLSNMDVHVYTKSPPDALETEPADAPDPAAIADDAS
ncbi:MAG: 16S rRNA (guanine(966)-N(2))-methyltransferase RsmD [Planctomycetaceae bacterium]|nr:16S rRNA (guanine(966)-N(2))-methyltransferase RsmD [Planctomycetaceae bacterium]